MIFKLDISSEAQKVLNRLDRPTKKRMTQRFEELCQDPFELRLSAPLTSAGGLRKSRIGGWRIIFSVDSGRLVVYVVTVDRRGQVYQRM